jgi:hypothetical protein
MIIIQKKIVIQVLWTTMKAAEEIRLMNISKTKTDYLKDIKYTRQISTFIFFDRKFLLNEQPVLMNY